MSSASASPRPTGQRTLLGHPIGLYVLFFTEMWERFSYYGMRALLILYCVNYFRWSQQEASTVYKVYTSFVYITPIIGGYLADRFLGNRLAVIIGAILMAIGHFLMAFEAYEIFIAALIFLILGNGMFKPNMSTQVGRLYPTNDGRRDAAYTIFYMGINLGAFLAPLACGWLAENTVGGYHTGFTMAGIGMVIGLVTYLVGQPLVKELDEPSTREAPTTQHDVHTESAQARPETRPSEEIPLTESEAARTPSTLGILSGLIPPVLMVLGLVPLLAAPVLWYTGLMDKWDAIMLGIAGVCTVIMGYVCTQVQNALRDRVVAILALGVFVMFFWAAFEQAGNVLNLWADKNTNRYLWKPMQPPQFPVPVVETSAATTDGEPQGMDLWTRFSTMFQLKPSKNSEEKSWGQVFEESFNPIPTTWFQSINALAIFTIAPLFAWMWITLDRRGLQPSIPMKMFIGLILVSASVAVMIQAARQEDNLTTGKFDGKLPAGIVQLEGGKLGFKSKKGHEEPFHAGRLTFEDGTLSVMGVLPDTERDRIIEQTAPKSFKEQVEKLAKESESIGKEVDGAKVTSRSVALDEIPPGFDMAYSALKKSEVAYDPESKTLTAYQEMKDREKKGLLVAGGEPSFRKAVGELQIESARFRVSPWWLVWSYVLATLGELCLSPVGLSMVSKLAPAKFATMLMGVWLMTSAFGNFAAGAAGEVWGTIAPETFFTWLTVIVAVAALVLLVIVRLLVKMMHGVK